ncbi:MAG: hypothetical protein J6I97_02335 [Agathobacter sp.]|nr:hypothetical protein [Agathobacter sp.]
MKTNILVNLKIALKRKNFWYAFIGMLCLSIGTYMYNLWSNIGKNIDNTPDAVSLYYLDNGYPFSMYILLLFPILLVLPYADIYTKDCTNNTNFFWLTKTKKHEWYVAQLIVVFVMTFITFLIPSVLNITLNTITFAENGNFSFIGDFRYGPSYFADVDGSAIFKGVLERGRWFKWIEYNMPQMYNVLYALLFSVTGGVLASFTYSISLYLGKGRIYIYLFPFVIVQILSTLDMISNFMPIYICTNLTRYLSSGQMKIGCSYLVFWIVMLLLAILSICLVRKKAKSDEL